MNQVIVIITITYYYFLSWLSTYWESLWSETDPLAVNIMIYNDFLSYWKHSPKLKWFTSATPSFITIAAVWRQGFRSLVCKCFFSYNPGWSGTHIHYLTYETHVTPGRWFSCPWTLQLFSHFKTTQYKWFTRLGLIPFYADWWECWPFREGGKKYKTREICSPGCKCCH